MKITNGRIDFSYWVLPVVLIIVQLVFVLHSMGQIRYEEIAESARGPWRFQNRLVADSSYSDLSWYATLIVAYNIFGYDIHSAKFVKLVIILVGLFCLAALLKKFLGAKVAWLPLLTIGLSPTLLYFNTLQTQYMLDFYYFLICLYLVMKLDFKRSSNYLMQGLLWVVAMWGWMNAQAFAFYLPIVGFTYFYKLLKHKSKEKKLVLVNVLFSFISFLLPLIVGFIYIRNREALIRGTSFEHGIFRSYGGFELNFDLFVSNVTSLFKDFFIAYDSYYFEIANVEFSGVFTALGVVFVFCATLFIGYRYKKYRLFILVAALIFLIDLIFINFIGPKGLGGIRRAGVLLALFYGFFTFVYFHFITKVRNTKRLLFMAIFGVFLLHHVIVLQSSFKKLSEDSPYRDRVWFESNGNARESLAAFVGTIQKQDLRLLCSENNEATDCTTHRDYSLIESSIRGYCYWNKLYCHQLWGYDVKYREFRILDANFGSD